MASFWRSWLLVWCGGVILFGVVLAGAAFEATSGPARLVVAFLDGPGEPAFDAHLRFSLAVCGAVSIGWGVMMLGVVQAAERLDRRTWLLVALSVLAWFGIDSTLSIATGFGRNVIPNVLLLVGFLIPMFASGVLRDAPARSPVRRKAS